MTYVTSDLHGYPLNDFIALLEKASFSDNDFCYVLGDVIDRGDDGVALLRWIMMQPNFELILGNHEAMMLSCDFLFGTVTEDSLAELTEDNLKLYMHWANNGATPTIRALRNTDKETIGYIVEYLKDSPLFEKVTVGERDFLLVHGGIGNFEKDKHLNEYPPHDLLWTRPKIDDRYFEDTVTVIGHTPTQYYGSEYAGRAIFTDTWINIDTGAASGGSPMLLRLDDMKEFYADR